MLRLRFQVWLLLVLALVLLLLLLHLVADYLTVQTRQIVALLQTLDVVSGELVAVRVLVAVWMVNIDVCVFIVNNNDPTAISNLVLVLDGVELLLLRVGGEELPRHPQHLGLALSEGRGLGLPVDPWLAPLVHIL